MFFGGTPLTVAMFLFYLMGSGNDGIFFRSGFVGCDGDRAGR